jgi:hypothetical protein
VGREPRRSKLGDRPGDFPLILAGVALLIALATAAFTLRGVLSARRNVVRPSH